MPSHYGFYGLKFIWNPIKYLFSALHWKAVSVLRQLAMVRAYERLVNIRAAWELLPRMPPISCPPFDRVLNWPVLCVYFVNIIICVRLWCWSFNGGVFGGEVTRIIQIEFSVNYFLCSLRMQKMNKCSKTINIKIEKLVEDVKIL